MNASKQQQAIIDSQESIIVNAFAGTGKTTTLLMKAAAIPKTESIVYLTFNKSIAEEATKKFAEHPHVKVQTAHGMAYGRTGAYAYKMRKFNYSAKDLIEIFPVKNFSLFDYMINRHVLTLFNMYCDSSYRKVTEVPYLPYLKSLTVGMSNEEKATLKGQVLNWVTENHDVIFNRAQQMWDKMDSKQIEITHSFYLKKFHLMNPKIKADWIFFDEAQDANPVMSDIVENQTCRKVFVGDDNQAIYGWRGAVNALQSFSYPVLPLTESYRFGDNVAKLANEILRAKNDIFENVISDFEVIGKGAKHKTGQIGYISRSNIGTIKQAVDVVIEGNPNIPYYFEGKFSTSFFTNDGVSLWDLYFLYTKQHDKIRHDIVKEAGDWEGMVEYADSVMDKELGQMMSLIQMYRKDAPSILKSLKDRECSSRDKANVIFSTTHKAKGLEYDHVVVNSDYMDGKSLGEYLTAIKETESRDLKLTYKNRAIEEFNMIYVALTRAMHTVDAESIEFLNQQAPIDADEASGVSDTTLFKTLTEMTKDFSVIK